MLIRTTFPRFYFTDYFLAKRKQQTFASSVHAGMDPRFAIDGITLSGSRIPSCFISAYDDLPWWAVELDKHYDIDMILFQTCK